MKMCSGGCGEQFAILGDIGAIYCTECAKGADILNRAARRRAAEDMRERCATIARMYPKSRIAGSDIANAIVAIPLPGDGE